MSRHCSDSRQRSSKRYQAVHAYLVQHKISKQLAALDTRQRRHEIASNQYRQRGETDGMAGH